ncbi:MAG: hypothetical protein Kow0013_24140 [Pararhodobacter sp.]
MQTVLKTPLVALAVAGLVLTGCGAIRESRMNPRNWFGQSESRDERPDLGPSTDIVDNRPLVAEVAALTIERTSSGALLRAEGVTPTAGWWDAELVPENFGRAQGGVLTFRFVAAAPREPAPDTGVQSRTVTVVYPVTEAQLETTSEIVVVGEGNSRRIRR